MLTRLSPNRLLRIKFLCVFAKVSEKFYPQQPSLAGDSIMALREVDVAVAIGIPFRLQRIKFLVNSQNQQEVLCAAASLGGFLTFSEPELAISLSLQGRS